VAAGRGDRAGHRRRCPHPGRCHPDGQGRHRAAAQAAGHRAGHLGRTHAEINAALLSAIAAARLTASGSPQADLWSREVKDHAVEAAHRALQDLPLLVGAGGFRADSALAKARADVGGLLYADGIHDSLLRSAGRTLTTPAPAGILRPRPADTGQPAAA
jgi:hypothetical protein